MAGSSAFYFSMILLVMGVAAGTRQLHECVSQGTASADALSQSAVSNAVASAFAECKGPPCDAVAQSKAEAIATAVAEAMAKAYADALAKVKCGKDVAEGAASADAVSKTTALASSLAQGAAKIQGGGNVTYVATATAKDIQPAIATALARALAACKT
ncbi:hypothetical protein N2152v2_002013 [Parachlorella kessleri]